MNRRADEDKLRVLDEAPAPVDIRVVSQPADDVEAVAFLVLMPAARSAQEDVRAIMAQVKAITAAKKRLREARPPLPDELDYEVIFHVVGDPLRRATPGGGGRAARARVEDRIRCAKASGLRNFPFEDFVRNEAWLAMVTVAQDLLAWTAMLCLDGALARAEPATPRDQLLHVAARLARRGRDLYLRIDEAWAVAGPARRRLRAPAHRPLLRAPGHRAGPERSAGAHQPIQSKDPCPPRPLTRCHPPWPCSGSTGWGQLAVKLPDVGGRSGAAPR